jgi:predicted dehydrogenase
MAGSDYDVSKDVLFPKSHAGAYHKDPRFSLVAAADPSEDSLKRFGSKWKVSNLYYDVEEMLAKERPDVLSITSSTDSHIRILEQALDSSVKVILLEKPVSNSFTEAMSVIPKVDKSQKAVLVNYGRRWNKNNILIKEWIDQGKMGALVKATMNYCVGIIHTGSHGLDLILWYFGGFDSVIGFGKVGNSADGVIDACFTLKTGANFFAMGFPRDNWNVWELDILMEKGRIRFLRGGRIVELMMPKEDPDFPKLKVLEPKEFPYENDWHNSMSNTVDSIYNILERGAPVTCSYFDGVVVLGWAVRAIESAQSGGERKSYVINGLR